MEKQQAPFTWSEALARKSTISIQFYNLCRILWGGYTCFMSTPEKSGKGIKLTKDITDLMFADNCIIFCKASKQIAKNLKYILDHYCKVFRSIVNNDNKRSNLDASTRQQGSNSQISSNNRNKHRWHILRLSKYR